MGKLMNSKAKPQSLKNILVPLKKRTQIKTLITSIVDFSNFLITINTPTMTVP